MGDGIEHATATPQRKREEAPAPENEPGGLASMLLAAQQGLGNAHTGQLARRIAASRRSGLARQPDGGTPPAGPTDAGVPPAAGVPATAAPGADLAAAEAFKAHAAFGPQNVTPGTAMASGPSATGGFEATYDPAAEQLTIRMRCGVNFKDALTGSGAGLTADPTVPNLLASVPPAGARRTAFIRAHQWQPDEKTTFLAGVKSSVEGAWSGQYEFHVNKPDWGWIGAKVSVDIQAHEQAGARAAADHLSIDSVKLPPAETLGQWGGGAVTGEGTQASATDQVMTVSSNDITGRTDNLLRDSVFFDNDSAALSAGSIATVNQFAARFNGSAPGTQGSRPANVTVEAHTSRSGSDEHNQTLAQQRADNVQAQLTAGGFTNVATRVIQDVEAKAGATGDAAHDRRVDLIADGGAAQVVIAHEFGHAFGLGDEYANDPGANLGGTPQPSGTRASHDPQTKAMQGASGLPQTGAVYENNDNIMSLGSVVQPQHYSTFHAALTTITSMPEWALGPKGPKPAPAGGAPAAGGAAPAPTGTPAPAPAGP